MNVYIDDFSLNCALGYGKKNVSRAIETYAAEGTKLPSTKSKKIPLISGRETIFHCCDSNTFEHIALPDEFNSKNNQLAASVLMRLKESVARLKSRFSSEQIGVVTGTSTSGISNFEMSYLESEHSKFNFEIQELGNLSKFVSAYFELSGPSYTISTACTSSAKAFIEGARLIGTGLCKAVIVGGCDSRSLLTLNGFDSLGAVSQSRTNPFSKNRNGINIGEGAAFFILSADRNAVKFAGFGESSDAFHISSPDPSGDGARKAMSQALSMANCKMEDIDYINLHGTGTIKNDAMEAAAISALGGESILCSATKPMTGHTLGAAGAIEAAICLLAFGTGNSMTIPPHIFDSAYPDELPKLNLSTSKATIDGRLAMSNSFAFGGSNVSLIFEKERFDGFTAE